MADVKIGISLEAVWVSDLFEVEGNFSLGPDLVDPDELELGLESEIA
ncbi:unknown protein, partial (plasmid) [Simkania negevensis Z]